MFYLKCIFLPDYVMKFSLVFILQHHNAFRDRSLNQHLHPDKSIFRHTLWKNDTQKLFGIVSDGPVTCLFSSLIPCSTKLPFVSFCVNLHFPYFLRFLPVQFSEEWQNSGQCTALTIKAGIFLVNSYNFQTSF